MWARRMGWRCLVCGRRCCRGFSFSFNLNLGLIEALRTGNGKAPVHCEQGLFVCSGVCTAALTLLWAYRKKSVHVAQSERLTPPRSLPLSYADGDCVGRFCALPFWRP